MNPLDHMGERGKKKAFQRSLLTQKIALRVYGNQEETQALSIGDSKVTNPVIRLYEGSCSVERAQEDSLMVLPIEKPIVSADVIALLIPHEQQPRFYKAHPVYHLKKGSTLVFTYGGDQRSFEHMGSCLCASLTQQRTSHMGKIYDS